MIAARPETCCVDTIESYSTNEVALDRNAGPAWDAAFLDGGDAVSAASSAGRW